MSEDRSKAEALMEGGGWKKRGKDTWADPSGTRLVQFKPAYAVVTERLTTSSIQHIFRLNFGFTGRQIRDALQAEGMTSEAAQSVINRLLAAVGKGGDNPS